MAILIGTFYPTFKKQIITMFGKLFQSIQQSRKVTSMFSKNSIRLIEKLEDSMLMIVDTKIVMYGLCSLPMIPKDWEARPGGTHL
jgi:hypothetical protein